ncbi:MAG TPA: histidine phosphatase family protein [Pseudolabrys sp.]|nr:histidine phosphatase family protein [Pseudolabrys sp.]
MRRLFLFRHAEAERSLPGTDDRARKLDDHGRRDAALIGSYMASHALLPDQALISPALRAQETWQLAAQFLQSPPPSSLVELLYDARPDAIMDVIRRTPANIQRVLILAHNPGLHEVAVTLIASGDVDARERLREKLPTSALLVIDFAFESWGKLHARSGRLERFVTPKSLTSAAN